MLFGSLANVKQQLFCQKCTKTKDFYNDVYVCVCTNIICAYKEFPDPQLFVWFLLIQNRLHESFAEEVLLDA